MRIILSLTILAVTANFANQTDAEGFTDKLVFLFAYSASKSSVELSENYRTHLEWHRDHDDSIVWYAWYVTQGDNVNLFIDGAFGVTGAEFDNRPDPVGDADDAANTFLPFADPQYRQVLRYKSELSTSAFLESGKPSPMMQVIYYHVRPGMQLLFESAVSDIAKFSSNTAMAYATYELLTGSKGGQYMLIVPMTGYSGFDARAHSLESIAREAVPLEKLSTIMVKVAQSVELSVSEMWQYQPDLSLIPTESKP